MISKLSLVLGAWGKIMDKNSCKLASFSWAVFALATGLVVASSSANAQFICGGSGTGAEPQASGGFTPPGGAVGGGGGGPGRGHGRQPLMPSAGTAFRTPPPTARPGGHPHL